MMTTEELVKLGYYQYNSFPEKCTKCGKCPKIEMQGDNAWSFTKTGLIFHRCFVTLWKKKHPKRT